MRCATWHGLRLGVALVLILALVSACSLFRGGTAQENAVQALVTTTRSAVLLVTAAGIAYDAGAFGEPGTPRAEDTWGKIAAESIRMNEALTAWTDAIKAGKDSSGYVSMVRQALAVIGALLPGKLRAVRDPVLWESSPVDSVARLSCPDSFRQHVELGGAR